MNNYTVTIDLKKNLKTHLSHVKTKITPEDLENIFNKYNTIGSFNFNDSNKYLMHIYSKYNIENNGSDIILDNKTTIINKYYKNPKEILLHVKGSLLFDNSMILDDKLREIIDLLQTNYNTLILNKLYNEYVLYFDDVEKQNITEQELKLFNDELNTLFYGDIKEQLLYSQIKNIPQLINNEELNKKIVPELNYVDYVKNSIYQNQYLGLQIKDKLWSNYEQLLYIENNNENNNNHNNNTNNFNQQNYRQLSDTQLVDTQTTNTYLANIQTTNKQQIQYQINLLESVPYTISDKIEALTNLHNYNNKLNEIVREIYYHNDDLIDIENYEANSNIKNHNQTLLKKISLNDLFNIHKVTNLFNFVSDKVFGNKNYSDELVFSFNNIFDENIYIYVNVASKEEKKQKQHIQIENTESKFVDKIIMFTNKLLKKKIQKIIRKYNYMQNKIYIDNIN